jgi:hypothetical protein
MSVLLKNNPTRERRLLQLRKRIDGGLSILQREDIHRERQMRLLRQIADGAMRQQTVRSVPILHGHQMYSLRKTDQKQD